MKVATRPRPIRHWTAFFLGTAALCTGFGLGTARADLADDLAVDAPMWSYEGIDVSVTGWAAGTLYSAHQDGGPSHTTYKRQGASGLAESNVQVSHVFDDGLEIGADTNMLLYHDALSGDDYGSDFFNEAYLYSRFALGRIEIGMIPGVGYTESLTGPKIMEQISLDDTDTSLFRDPTTGEAFHPFSAISAVQSSSNAAKLRYISPRLLGLSLGASFTPSLVKSALPWTGNPANGPDHQENIWEVSLNFSQYFDFGALGVSAAYAQGSATSKSAGRDDLYDMSLGTQLTVPMGGVKAEFGVSARQSNAYGFDTGTVLHSGRTRLLHGSAAIEYDPWRFGVEYSNGDIDGGPGFPDFYLVGYQAAASYRVNGNMHISAGWQGLHYARASGAFYNGDAKIGMNGAFLSFAYSVE